MTSNMVRRYYHDSMSPFAVFLKSIPGLVLMIVAIISFLWDGWGVCPPSIVLTYQGLIAIGGWLIGWALLPTPRPRTGYERLYRSLGRHHCDWTLW
ncbi:MAG: hypothetical protein HY975_01910 [Candidatus Kerfeldbacteria bacterium]|nr:hypothetical protein [Candidatus Kerfeldbacteria bacterium]